MANYFYHARITYGSVGQVYYDDFSGVYESDNPRNEREDDYVSLEHLSAHAVKYANRGENSSAVIISVSETTLKFY